MRTMLAFRSCSLILGCKMFLAKFLGGKRCVIHIKLILPIKERHPVLSGTSRSVPFLLTYLWAFEKIKIHLNGCSCPFPEETCKVFTLPIFNQVLLGEMVGSFLGTLHPFLILTVSFIKDLSTPLASLIGNSSES